MASILIHLDFFKAFYIQIDALDFALKAILSQMGEDAKLHDLVAFYLAKKFQSQKSITSFMTKKSLLL